MHYTLPPGVYYIGDISLALSSYNLNKNSDFMGKYRVKTHEGNSFEYVVAPTTLGNGIYNGSNGDKFIVLKGCIGMVPIYLLDEHNMIDNTYKFDYLVDFTWNHGIFTISSIDFNLIINTNLYLLN